ncbi:phosphate/phosphite/phosphonate ABC transporter substrate-binding protein [Granulosicoccus antarcticus]|uniref:ABC transporter, phosphonate, periplasmic substrate-binding protein n=1 Tax=Granulosicoccus antarcticus IMCC3135 TaxID=1192854 RepID=A0A2Z2NPZ3_9GAMM|nr:PhnD/SsuA/transferrin family substrate-binding protein [Granulosicoccus antarcticus]ASJ73363.1 hypothetical protein IMCC3135_16405 [Granulosicoccus antarcticus IMCC3135]
MIASLAMYQRPQLVEAHSRLWGLIRKNLHDAGLDAPAQLSQDTDENIVWEHPELVLSQTCGMPYRTWLHENVELVGTPDYGLMDCPPGFYRSALVVRHDDPRHELPEFRSSTFAYNQSFSQSGYAAPFWHLEPHGFWFENRLHTEQHLESARAVAQGQADIASLDAVSWRLMSKYEPFAANLRVLEWTAPTPGLPLITAKGNDPVVIFTAVERAFAQLQDEDKDLLGILGLVSIPKEDYLALQNPTPGS